MVVDATKDEVVGEYVCTGRSSDDLWTRFLYLTPELQKLRESWRGLGDVRQLSSEEIAHKEVKARQREEQKQREQIEREARALSADDRHQLYSQVFDELPVGDDLLADYDKRGFSEAEKNQAGFKSVVQWHHLKTPVDPRLPGSNADGTGLTVSGDGYLCPIPDPDGRIIGCQVRLFNPPSDRPGRYRYLSSSHATLPLFPPGENPIGYFRPKGKPKMIALVEGVGAKPILVSERFNAIAIGCPGGLWLASPNMFRSYLGRALAEVGGDAKLIIFPDAGDVANKLVTNRWGKVAEFLSKGGWAFSFGWWGQVDKSCNDADELTQQERAEISFISGNEFFSIAALGVKNSEAKKEQEQKILDKEQEFQQLSAIRDKLTRITETPFKVVNVPTLEGVLPSLIEPGTVNIINSPTATGKSKGSRPIVEKAGACSSWHNRLALAESTATDFDITFKNEKSGNLSRVKKVAACSPSMVSYNPQHLRDKGIVFIDECDQVADFSFSNICNREGIRPLILTALENQIGCALSGNGNLLALSADVTQKEINYFRALTPDGVAFRYIVNQHKPKRGTVHLDNSRSPEGLVDELIQRLKAGEQCFVLDDLKNGVRGCKSIAEFVRNNIPEIADKVIEIHADSTDDPRVKAFRNQANEESKQYLCIICSPSIVSGISIVNQLFINGVFVFAQGILNDRSIKQFINRIRGAKNIYLWVAEEGFPPKTISKDLFTPEEIKDYYKRNYEVNARHIMTLRADYKPMQDEWYSPHFELYCKNLAYHACTMKYLRRFTIEHLREEGYTVVDTDFIPDGGTQEIEDALKMGWAKIEVSEALAIASARFLSESEMDILKHADHIPPELLPAYKKTQMRETFGEPLIEVTTFEHKSTKQNFTGYAAMALKNVGGEYARYLDNFWLLSQDVSESIGRDYGAEARQLKHGERFPADIRWNTRKRKCREWLGLKDFLKIGVWWEPQDFKFVAERAKSKPKEVKDTFNYTVADVHDNQLFDELIRRLGLKIATKSVKGEKWKLRTIEEESWNHCQLYVQYKESLKAESPVTEAVAVTVMPTVDEIAGFADLITEAVAEDRETYEAVVDGVNPQIVEGALQKVSQEVRDRLATFYEVPEPVQLSLNDIVLQSQSIESQSIETQFIAETAVTIEHEEIINQVDREIQLASPLFTTQEPVTTWTRRLNRAQMMSGDIAQLIYGLVPQQLLTAVWAGLTRGVQDNYVRLFASG